MTASGYPFVLKRLRREAPLGAAEEMFRGSPDDVSVNASVLRDPDGEVRGVLVNRQVNFFESERFLITPQGPVRVPVPAKSSFRGFAAGQLVFSLEEAWREHRAGALVSLDLDACLADTAGAAAVSIVTPGPRESIEDVATAGRLEVEGDAFLVAVDAQKVSALAAHEGRTPGAGVVSLVRVFDLDDPSPHIAEQHRAVRSGEDPREIEHGQAGERP